MNTYVLILAAASLVAIEYRQLSEVVEARKRSQQDAELLSNRLNLLRTEGVNNTIRVLMLVILLMHFRHVLIRG